MCDIMQPVPPNFLLLTSRNIVGFLIHYYNTADNAYFSGSIMGGLGFGTDYWVLGVLVWLLVERELYFPGRVVQDLDEMLSA